MLAPLRANRNSPCETCARARGVAEASATESDAIRLFLRDESRWTKKKEKMKLRKQSESPVIYSAICG